MTMPDPWQKLIIFSYISTDAGILVQFPQLCLEVILYFNVILKCIVKNTYLLLKEQFGVN